MRMDTTIKRKRRIPGLSRSAWLGIGVAFVALSFVMAGASLWEAFGGAANVRVIRVPGFHELKLDEAGLYVGVYQQTGTAAIPARELSQLDVRVMAKDEYEEVPVLMNTSGQAVSRMGFRGMPVFNFVAPKAGDYTLSAVYVQGMTGPNVPIMVFHQGVIDVKQTLIVGALFFALFLCLGIWVLVKSTTWAAEPESLPARH